MAFNATEFFGTTARDVFEQEEKAEGYLAGQRAAQMLHAAIHTDHGNRSREYREAVAEGLRDNL